jgi:hypothetical protein
MKDEDLDWQVYHLIADGQATTVPALAASTGRNEQAIRASLDRLASGFLIGVSDGRAEPLSIHESLFRCQCKNDTSLPYTVENGVIRMKKQE